MILLWSSPLSYLYSLAYPKTLANSSSANMEDDVESGLWAPPFRPPPPAAAADVVVEGLVESVLSWLP